MRSPRERFIEFNGSNITRQIIAILLQRNHFLDNTYLKQPVGKD